MMKKFILILCTLAVSLFGFSWDAYTLEKKGEDFTSWWSIYDNDPSGAFIYTVYSDYSYDGQIAYVSVFGDGIKNGFALKNAQGENWNEKHNNITWTYKAYGIRGVEDYMFYVTVKLTDGSTRYLAYRSERTVNYGNVLEYPIGWCQTMLHDTDPVISKTITRNLDNDLHMWELDKEIDYIVNFAVRGSAIKMYKVETFETTLINQENITLFDPKTPESSTWRIYDSDPAGATIQLSDSGAVLSGDGIKNGFVLKNEEGENWDLKAYNLVKFEGFFPDSDAIIYLTVKNYLGDLSPIYYLVFTTNKSMADYGNYGNVLVTYLPKAKDGKVSAIIDIQKILQTNNKVWEKHYLIDLAVRGSGTVTSVIAYDAYEDLK